MHGQIVNLATNDAASLSLSEYAVIAIAPELAPNSLAARMAGQIEWDRSTLGGSVNEKEGAEESQQQGKSRIWRMLCL